MTARNAAAIASLALGLAVLCGVAACTNFYEIPIETPIQPKMDVSPFQRVLVAGFIGGGTDDVDANLETVRLLRSQLRIKSSLRVIEADVLPLAESRRGAGNGSRGRRVERRPVARRRRRRPAAAAAAPAPRPGRPEAKIRNEKDLEKYQGIFADAAFWKKLGEEYQNPLIVTGTVLFTPHAELRLRHDASRKSTTSSAAGASSRSAPTGAQGLHPAAEVHLHRRPHRRDALLRDASRRDPLQRAAEHAGAVVLLRADGQAHSELPEHAQHPEDPRHARPPEVAASGFYFFAATAATHASTRACDGPSCLL